MGDPVPIAAYMDGIHAQGMHNAAHLMVISGLVALLACGGLLF